MDFSTVTQLDSKFQKFEEQFTKFLIEELKNKRTTLYEYQIKAVLETKNHFKKHETQGTKAPPALIVAPTGSGKSGMVTMLPYVLGSAKVVVLTPSIVITKQLAESFGLAHDINKMQVKGQMGKDIRKESFFYKTKISEKIEHLNSLIEGSYDVIHSTKQVKYMDVRNLIIVNAQKFGGRANTSLVIKRKVGGKNKEEEEAVVEDVRNAFKNFTTLIVDEAHHYPAPTWEAIYKNFENKQIIFLTATPFRGKGEPILDNQKITYEIKTSDVRGETIRNFGFKEYLNLPNDRSLQEKKLNQIGKDIKAILDEHDLLERNVKHKAIVLVRLTEEAEDGKKYIDKATYCTSKKESDGYLEDFNKNDDKYRIIFVCGRLLEGYDNPNISVCVILRNVTSKLLFSQFIGRCMRKSSESDKIKGCILSYTCFNQKPLWEEFDKIAHTDPVEEKEVDE